MDAPDHPARNPSSAPQLRTLLLTDLCDSTGLVERLGDTPAAELFREHDRLVLKLQQQWRGRLIDRSDGLLLLFERPIDGLGFALDYNRGLGEIGVARNVKLHARAGLHVGEVLTWRNSDEAVRVGAKPLEVEGLAKPMAGRLMAMARPGQILLSAVAEPLAHRAARELGERGQQLLWKSHGRWCFKGVPSVQEVYEVGEPGLALLRAPPSTPKAWRDLPLWRRPAALAAEVVLVIGIGIGVWFVTRPQPAIAFGERDWVVVGDLRNLTGQSVLDESLAQAFRISLEQSRYVNVLSDLKARDTLARMQRKPDTPLDRAIASEIALRDGARAVILPTVSEVGGRIRVSAEVIDPHTQTTVYAESADGTGAGSALNSIDTVTAALRGKLGEALKSIEKDSAPLPQVTTRNLDALRAYALGQKAYAQSHYADAAGFYQRAVVLDPNFALAHLGSVRTSIASVDSKTALPHLQKAVALRDRLPPREALYLDAWSAEFAPGYKAPPKWKLLAEMYPDYFAGPANYAGNLISENRFVEAMPYARAATVPQNTLRSQGYALLGRAELAQEHHASAREALDQSLALGLGDAARRRADLAAVQFNFVAASALLEKRAPDQPTKHLERIAFAIDEGAWSRAAAAADSAVRDPNARGGILERVFGVAAGVVALSAGNTKEAGARFESAIDAALAVLAQPAATDRKDEAYIALAAAYASQRGGDSRLAKRVLGALNTSQDVFEHPKVAELSELLHAGQERLAGDPAAAVARLRRLVTGHELFQTHVALLEAYAAAGETEAALIEARWLAAHRGLAYVEHSGGQALQALNVADTRMARLRAAELLAELGRHVDAQREAQAFLKAWPSAELPNHLRRRADKTLAASKQ